MGYETRVLTELDVARWMTALMRAPTERDGFMPWIQSELHEFFPFKRLFIAHGELVAGEIRITHSMATGHDERYLQQLARTFELTQRTSLAWWLQNREPFYIDPAAPPAYTSAFEIREITEFGLENVAAHGVVSAKGTVGTYFAFAGTNPPLTTWHLEALRLLAPVMNELYLRIVAQELPHLDLNRLTPRQLTIVRAVADGADDKAISSALGITAKTVRNQLTAVYAKLGIHSRRQLIGLLR
jgi:DNA-binding CsgD family transcriptional regulator